MFGIIVSESEHKSQAGFIFKMQGKRIYSGSKQEEQFKT